MTERRPIGLTVPYREVGYKEKSGWVGLTDAEIDYYIVHHLGTATKKNLTDLIRLCEGKLKEKNT